MLQREHSAILLTFIKLPFSIKTFVLSIFKWPRKTGLTVDLSTFSSIKKTSVSKYIFQSLYMSFSLLASLDDIVLL